MADTSNALPMVLLPPGNAGELCFTVVKLWSTHGMLRRSLWIRSEDVADGEHGVPHASGWLVEGNGATQVEVDRAQAMTKLGRRTLVVLSTPGLDSSSTGHISPAAQPLVHYAPMFPDVPIPYPPGYVDPKTGETPGPDGRCSGSPRPL